MPASQRSWSSPRLAHVACATSGWGRIRKRSSRDRLDDGVGDLLGLDDLRDLARACPWSSRLADHRRVDELRAQAGDADAPVVVGDGEVLGHRDGGVLGRRVAERAELGQQAGGGGGRAEVALAALEHLRQQRAGGPDVRHHVDAPEAVPVLVAQISGPPGGPAIPALEKKRSIGPLASSACAIRAWMSCSRPTSVRMARPSISPAVACAVLEVQIGDGDRPGLLVREAQRERPADPARRHR